MLLFYVVMCFLKNLIYFCVLTSSFLILFEVVKRFNVRIVVTIAIIVFYGVGCFFI